MGALVVCLGIGCSARPGGEYVPSKRAVDRNNEAVRLLRENAPEKALEAVSAAIKIDPSFFKAHANKAAILRRMGRNDEAISSLREVIRLRPRYAEAYVPLGILLECTGKKDEAAPLYRKGLDLMRARQETDGTLDAATKVQTAVALFLLNEKREAMKVLKETLEKKPGDEYVKTMHGWMENGNRDAVITGLMQPATKNQGAGGVK